MRYTRIGDRNVSVIGLGVWQFGSAGWGWGSEFAAAEANSIVERALELGVNMFDTAEIYGRGQSESLLGAALGSRRDEAFIASKVWPIRAVRSQVRRAAERSLARLDTDRIDLYQLHWPNPLIPLRSTMKGMRDLYESGLVGAVGVSNFRLSRWRGADAAFGSPVITNQVSYSLLDRAAERDLLPFALREGRTVIAYSPLAQGALTGRYDASKHPGGVRRFNALFTPSNIAKAEPILGALRRIGRAHAATPAQIALAWCIRFPNVIAIPGAKSVGQIEENAASADIELTDDDLSELDRLSQTFRVTGRWRDPQSVIRWLLTR